MITEFLKIRVKGRLLKNELTLGTVQRDATLLALMRWRRELQQRNVDDH